MVMEASTIDELVRELSTGYSPLKSDRATYQPTAGYRLSESDYNKEEPGYGSPTDSDLTARYSPDRINNRLTPVEETPQASYLDGLVPDRQPAKREFIQLLKELGYKVPETDKENKTDRYQQSLLYANYGSPYNPDELANPMDLRLPGFLSLQTHKPQRDTELKPSPLPRTELGQVQKPATAMYSSGFSPYDIAEPHYEKQHEVPAKIELALRPSDIEKRLQDLDTSYAREKLPQEYTPENRLAYPTEITAGVTGTIGQPAPYENPAPESGPSLIKLMGQQGLGFGSGNVNPDYN